MAFFIFALYMQREQLALQRKELKLQRQELRLQRQELKMTREELRRAADAQSHSSEHLERQARALQMQADSVSLSQQLEAQRAIVDYYSGILRDTEGGQTGRVSMHISDSYRRANNNKFTKRDHVEMINRASENRAKAYNSMAKLVGHEDKVFIGDPPAGPY